MTTQLSEYIQTLPLHESVRPRTQTCAACGLGYKRSSGGPHLCALCLGRPEEIAALCATNLVRVSAEQRAADQAWTLFLEGLSEETTERWIVLSTARQRAQSKLEKARTGAKRASTPDESIALDIATAQAEWASLTSKIERTRKALDNPLSPVLEREKEYTAQIALLQEQRMRWEIALSEVYEVSPEAAQRAEERIEEARKAAV